MADDPYHAIQHQDDIMRDQDEEIAGMTDTVRTTKAIAEAICREASEQTKLIEQVDGRVDRTKGNLRREQRRQDKLIKDMNGTIYHHHHHGTETSNYMTMAVALLFIIGGMALVFLAARR